MAAAVAFGLNRSESHRRSLRDLFYALCRHLDEFQWAMYGCIAHSQHHDNIERRDTSLDTREDRSLLITPEMKQEVADLWRVHARESVDMQRSIRNAVSTLNADKLQLEMLFTHKQSECLVDLLDALTRQARTFLTTQKGGRTPEYEKVKDLPVDATIAKVQEQMKLLWVNTAADYPAATEGA